MTPYTRSSFTLAQGVKVILAIWKAYANNSSPSSKKDPSLHWLVSYFAPKPCSHDSPCRMYPSVFPQSLLSHRRHRQPTGMQTSVLQFGLGQSAPGSDSSACYGSEVIHLHWPEGQGSLLDMVCQDRQKQFSLSFIGNSRNWCGWHSTGSNCWLTQVGT